MAPVLEGKSIDLDRKTVLKGELQFQFCGHFIGKGC
jgi:hypothetical protein